MPPRKTKNAAPNQRDTRHENGLAAPGKRITKKHSSGALNGLPNGKPVSSVSPPALPSTGLNQGLRFPRTPGADSIPSTADTATAVTSGCDYGAASDSTPRDRTASEASVEEGGAEMADNPMEAATLGPSGAEASGAGTPPHAPQGSPLSTVSTILTYYPLRDAISILILLLSLPPTLVLVIQSLFASLTFVPPTAGISLSTLNVKEMFNASNLGYPALATILIVDLIFWAFWLPMWKPMQSIFLDFSQAVIAVSLSGAAASNGGPTYSIATSTLVVCMVHVLRYRAIHLTALDYLRSVLHKFDIGLSLDLPASASSVFAPIPPVEQGWIFTVIRTILGIHIVSQGVTTCIRRSLVKANERDQSIPSITRTDPEPATTAESGARAFATNNEVLHQVNASASSDGRSPGPSPSQSAGRARESTSKKKKKQANQVRSQQPLWAAIASTKVTFVKEMEQRDAADDAREAAAKNTNNTSPTFTSAITPNADHITIMEVRDTEVYFSVELSPDSAAQSAEKVEEGVSIGAGIDRSKPFFLRINGATWSSTRIMSSATGDEADGKARFDGEIFGLTPMSSFLCEAVGIATGQTLCSVRLVTQATPSAEQATTPLAQAQQPALRPSSPITTLKQSVLAAEAKRDEVRNRTRKSKKDQKGAISDIRKEINQLRAKLDSSGLDDKQERRLQQITQHKNQAEEATTDIKREIDAFGELPGAELAASEAKRAIWQAAADSKRSAEKDHDHAKAEADRDLCHLKAEVDAAKVKHERIAARSVQKAEELQKLTAKQQAEMTAKQRREHERAMVVQSRESEKEQYIRNINAMEAESRNLEFKMHDAAQELASLQSWSAAPPPYTGLSSPPTPEGVLPGTNGSLSPSTNGYPVYGPQPFQSPYHSNQPSMCGPQRGRSSSMLSQVSGFTDNDGGDSYAAFAHPQTWPTQHPTHANPGAVPWLDDRKESEGSGSGSYTNGSTGSNSPRPDAKPFIPAASKVGTIGPPSKSREKVPQSPAVGGGGR